MPFGAQGTNYLGIPTGMLGDLLATRNKYNQRNRDDAEFESMLGTSELSEADKQLARLYRHAPQIGQMVDRQRREEAARRQQAAMQEDRQRQQEFMVKERQAAEDAQRKAVEEQKKAAQAALVEGAAQTGTTEYLRPQFARSSDLTMDMPGETGMVSPNQMGASRARMGIGGPKTRQFTEMAGIKIMPDEAFDIIARHDPGNPAIQGVMKASEYKQRQAMQARTLAAEREKQTQLAAKELEKKQEEQDRGRRIERARAFLNREGFKATDDELATFDLATDGGKNGVDPFKAANDIRKERERQEGKRKSEGKQNESHGEKERQRIAGLVAQYNAALEAAKGDTNDKGEVIVPATKEQRAKVIELRELLKSEGIEPPSGDKPVDIMQFKKKPKQAAPVSTPIATVQKITPEHLQHFKDLLADPSTPESDKVKLRAIIAQQEGK